MPWEMPKGYTHQGIESASILNAKIKESLMEVYVLEHYHWHPDKKSSQIDTSVVPCGVFLTITDAKSAVVDHTPGKVYQDWHLHEWPGGDLIEFQYYETDDGWIGCWRIVGFQIGEFRLKYRKDVDGKSVVVF